MTSALTRYTRGDRPPDVVEAWRRYRRDERGRTPVDCEERPLGDPRARFVVVISTVHGMAATTDRDLGLVFARTIGGRP